ncbi:hypothetical protein LPJ55_002957 [Coemansia sp. RSA 990]|nr:hypothetical protein LPJ68_001247 [Coemansia sp. RSA 1086]KAJ1872570.1 hypothetical protein LPJ55_002957 [Coemansia sp. RSA 990]KAJ2674675.1 hypothetical protein IWW42_001521 [Coemansia sp. RSA 1085]
MNYVPPPHSLPFSQQQQQQQPLLSPPDDSRLVPLAPPQAPSAPPPHPGWSVHRSAPLQQGDATDYRHRPYPPIPVSPFYAPTQPFAAPYAAREHCDMPAAISYLHPHMMPPQPHQIPQLPRRVRCTQACNHCHRRKARCVRNQMPDGTVRCDNCIREGITCEWRESRRRGPKRRARASALDDQGDGDKAQQAASRNAASIANLLNATTTAADSSSPSNGENISSALSVGSNPNMSGKDPASANLSEDGRTKLSEDGSSPASAKLDGTSRDSSTDKPAPDSAQQRLAQHYVLPSSRLPKGVQVPSNGNLVEQFMALEDVELREAVLAYYAYFYGFCPILHPSTLLRKVVSGTLDPLLDDSLRATTSMFVSKKLGRKIDAGAMFSRLVTAITIRPEAPSVDEVCAFQLASIGVSGVRGFVCFDTLKSAVTSLLMQLNWHELDRYAELSTQQTWEEWVEAEIKRRVFWINYKIDSHHASIAGRPPVIDEDKVFVRAPCSDSEWDELSRDILVRNCCCDGESSLASYPAGPWSDPDSAESSSSDSDSAEGSHTRTCRTLVSGVQEELSRSFRLITPYESFMARISTLQRDAKASWVQRSGSSGTCNERDIPLLGQSPLFKRYHEEICQWRREYLAARTLRDSSLPPWEASFFGSVRHRIFLVRVRYYCINIYAPGVTILLHSANRRSFFTEARQQTAIATHSSRDSSTSPPPLTAHEPEEIPEDEQIARILNQTFGPTWCQGLVATDIEPSSWDLSVSCAHELADCLRDNQDIPLEFLDMVIPLFVFVAITVLIRQIRRCQAALADTHKQLSSQERAELEGELHHCLRDAQTQWQAIRDMGSVWRVDGIAKLLNNMHIDEIEKAAEQLASISL